MEETLTQQDANLLGTIDTNVNLMSSDSIDLVVPKRGEIHNGTIVKTSADQILIDIGYKSEGTVSQHELSKLSDVLSTSYHMFINNHVNTHICLCA